ncbi:MAG: tRNA (adenosine(37)-N6)-dimethylallyltransferase MiaA [Deltaproteobacteria bacterium]|nr:tRNA (adenosine(37)-N6)-dimethylallyltransferase MiaA [Deltaproteobacteria bacterium]
MVECPGKIAVIVGPTAVGKTSLAMTVASAFDCEIVSADSMQVYRYMDIGTAKPTVEERITIPHHLIDVVDPDEEFNASSYVAKARDSISIIAGRNKRALVVGGTGLYIRVLLGGILEGPSADKLLRKRLMDEMAQAGSAGLHARLSVIDPATAERLHRNDAVRIIRALEVKLLTGESIAEQQGRHRFDDEPYKALILGLALERQQLYGLIDSRTEDMFQRGLVDEVNGLLVRGYHGSLKPMQSLCYRPVVDYLEKRLLLSEAKDIVKNNTRHYARRQITWFKRDKSIEWHAPDDTETIHRKIGSFFDEQTKS